MFDGVLNSSLSSPIHFHSNKSFGTAVEEKFKWLLESRHISRIICYENLVFFEYFFDFGCHLHCDNIHNYIRRFIFGYRGFGFVYVTNVWHYDLIQKISRSIDKNTELQTYTHENFIQFSIGNEEGTKKFFIEVDWQRS